jgi:hypothetical protein
LRDELKIAKNKLKTGDRYPGVASYVWANKKSELIFQYRGDCSVWASSGKIERLTQTDKPERIVAYQADDKGIFIWMKNACTAQRLIPA